MELRQIAEQIRLLEKFEFQVAKKLGSSAEDIDSVIILLEVKNKAPHNVDYSLSLWMLRELRDLRLRYSRVLQNLPVHLEVHQSPPGVSRSHSRRAT